MSLISTPRTQNVNFATALTSNFNPPGISYLLADTRASTLLFPLIACFPAAAYEDRPSAFEVIHDFIIISCPVSSWD